MVRAARHTILRGALLAFIPTMAMPVAAQQPQWAPSRLPAHAAARPISQAPQPGASSAFLADSPSSTASASPQIASGNSAPAASEQLGSGVTLRWRNVAPTAASQQAVAQSARLRQQFAQQAQSPEPQTGYASAGTTPNPLRSQIMQAAYQQEGDNIPLPFGGNNNVAPPTLPQSGSPLPNLPEMLPANPPPAGGERPNPPDFNTPNLPQPDSFPPADNDPLSNPELPPPPTGGSREPQGQSGSILENDRPANPFPRQEEASPADRSPELLPPPRGTDNNGSELKRRQEITSSGSCDEMRARIHANPITAVSLDTSPDYGAGFRVAKDAEQQRLDFAASAPVREWTDYRGNVVATGRMIDLRDGRVVIDNQGREQLIPFRDLSDVDTAYVGQAWNIPETCGMGYDPFNGRNFVPSTVQWTASGLCHKPLYFEQVQLERYGHEIGPVLQPLVSSAHFFGSIPLLPYKMGIHPPNECQYALGYYRPGNCAPYMLQPIPWSLRGAAVQAAATTGAAALIP